MSQIDCAVVSVMMSFGIYAVVCGLGGENMALRFYPFMLCVRGFISVSTWEKSARSHRHRFKTPFFRYLCECSLLARPVLWSEALPGADDLLGSHSSPRGSPVLLLLILRLYGVDTALRRNIHFNLEKTGQPESTRTARLCCVSSAPERWI